MPTTSNKYDNCVDILILIQLKYIMYAFTFKKIEGYDVKGQNKEHGFYTFLNIIKYIFFIYFPYNKIYWYVRPEIFISVSPLN